MARTLLVMTALSAVLVTTAAAGGNAFPPRIELPDGFEPEGVAIAGDQFYVGSIPTGRIYRGNLRTGAGAMLVPAQSGRASIGLKVDRSRIFVAGGPTGMGSCTTLAPERTSRALRCRRAEASSTTSS